MAGNAIEVHDLLPPSIEDLGDRIRGHMEEQRVAGRVAWSGAGEAALNAFREKLSFDVARSFATAWAAFEDLRKYKDSAAHPKDTDEEYELGANSVEVEAEPQLVIRLGPLAAPPMEFGYTISAKFEGVKLTIRNAAVTAAALGAGEVTAVLTLAGHPLHDPCRLAEAQLPGRLDFDPPVPIP